MGEQHKPNSRMITYLAAKGGREALSERGRIGKERERNIVDIILNFSWGGCSGENSEHQAPLPFLFISFGYAEVAGCFCF